MTTILPAPIDILLDPISLIILSMYSGLMAWEANGPAKKLPVIKGWMLRGLSSFFVFFFLSSYLPIFTDAFLAQYQVFDLTKLGTWGGAASGIIIFELGVYLWHWTLHSSNILWHGFHQMHHSAERFDTFGAFYFSPMDMIGWTFVGSLSLVLVIGITPEAATLVLLTTTLMAIFTHINVNTAHWLGYIIQRPESHSAHNEQGRHPSNYCELPIFDMLFGTFVNPKTFIDETDFYSGTARRAFQQTIINKINKGENENGKV